MAKYQQLIEHLPSLYRPQIGDSGLASKFLQAVGQLLDEMQDEMNGIMQSRWYTFSDNALYDLFINLDRKQRGLEQLNPIDPEHRDIINAFPHLHDLARLGALLSLPPWREPLPLREKVEAYRERLGLFVKLYRNGLGTVNALRTVVEAELPPIEGLPWIQRERSFSVEEYAPIVTTSEVFPARGGPKDGEGENLNLIGPLMRWRFFNDGLEAAPLTLYIQGISAIPDQRDATENPLLELFATGGAFPRVGIGYQATIAADSVLRLRPAFQSWLGLTDGVLSARSDPTDTLDANPTADGPWVSPVGAPTGMVTAMHQSQDHALWVAVDQPGGGQLWRHDGQSWTRVLSGLALGIIHCIFEHDQELLLGTASSLLRMPLYPDEGEAFTATEITALSGRTVYDMLRDKQGRLWLATDNGAAWLNPDDSLTDSDLQGTEIYALHQDRNGVIYFGGTLGLFQLQPGIGHWYWYSGKEESDQIPDWNRYTPGELPQPSEVFLPPVNSIHVGLDASVWLGTRNGIARYRARPERGLTYKTLLEAYPDLVEGEVFAIREDQRGLIWFCTDRGLFRYDGRDFAQFQTDSERWVSQGRADSVYRTDQAEPRDFWQYQRTAETPAWRYFDRNLSQWTVYSDSERSRAEVPVRLVEWTDSAAADLGTWDGDSFVSSGTVPMADLHMRVKPTDERIVNGGLPAVPRLPKGESTWRYLSLETAGMPESPNRPWWTREGRLVPPPDHTAPYPGRYGQGEPDPKPPEQVFDNTVFAYYPAAKVRLQWSAKRTYTVMVRLQKISADEVIHPAIIDRVYRGMNRVRPAGIRVMLAVEEQTVRGEGI